MNQMVGEQSTQKASNVIGVLWMLVAVTALTSMFAIAKHLMNSLPIYEVGLFRFVMSLLFYLPWVFRSGIGALKTDRPIAHLSRGCLGAASLAASIYAVHHMRLADATVLAFTIPLWSIVFAAFFLHERIRLHRSIATFIGFLGVVIMVKPHTGFEPAAAIAVLSAVLATSAITTMKSLTRTEPTERIVFYFLFIGSIVMGVPALLVFQAPSASDWAWLVLLGFVGSVGQYCMTRAYTAGDMTVIAPFDFARVIIAGLFGYLLFDELPDAIAILGASVIVASCVYIVHYEAIERRSASTL
ncbi:MAG: drug/metabolite transporter (DMT)-like permease [Gammaproteobacteria bacterium]|jgi:drug/metabolite transporter (DMT)-like permease